MQMRLILINLLFLLNIANSLAQECFIKNIRCQNGLIDPAGKMYALLVGVDWPGPCYDYKLKGPSEEINNLAHFLSNDKQQYNIVKLINEEATYKNIIRCLSRIDSIAKSEDRILFYYSGHASPWGKFKKKLSTDLKNKLHDNPDGEFFLFPFHQPTNRYDKYINSILSIREITKMLNHQSQADSNQIHIRQNILIIDACYGKYFINFSPLTTYMYDNELPANGFYALTSLISELNDGLIGPIILDGFKGAADRLLDSGNHNQKVSFWELARYIDCRVQKELGTPRGENYSSRYILIGSGEVNLSVCP